MVEGEHMIPGEHYFKCCECDYCLRVRRRDQEIKYAMEHADEFYMARTGEL